ncbi:MAG TPA: hypothetical protein VNO50_02150 [Pyrinomonadaceae bacterium]|nr:hypothetical protein [Pyrinomonadaceae bacterium]
MERTSFHAGQLLTADDLNREQDYFRNKLKRHNRVLHGFGVVSGLRVSIAGGKVLVEPGFALDCEGNEIAISEPQMMNPLSATAASRVAYVNIRYAESCTEKTTIESFEIGFGEENTNRGHRHRRAKWLACGMAHPLTIAKLRNNSQGWSVDRGYRPPEIK